MTTTAHYGLELTLPTDVRDRYDLKPNTAIRIVETRDGILLVPLTDEPMDADLVEELESWQAIDRRSLSVFPFLVGK